MAESLIGRVASDNYKVKYDRDTYWRSGTFASALRDGFKYGRVTVAECRAYLGRMPNPENSCEGKGPGKDGLKQIFVDNIFKGKMI